MLVFLKKIRKRIPKLFIFLCLNFVFTLCFTYFFYIIVLDETDLLSKFPISNIKYMIVLIMPLVIAMVSSKCFKIESYYYLFPFQSFITLLSVFICYGIQDPILLKYAVRGNAFNPLISILLFYYIFDKDETRKTLNYSNTKKLESPENKIKYKIKKSRKIKLLFLISLILFLILLSFNINLLILPFEIYGFFRSFPIILIGTGALIINLHSVLFVFVLDFFLSFFFLKKPVFNFIFKAKIMTGFRNKIIPDKESKKFAEDNFLKLYISILILAKFINLFYFIYFIADNFTFAELFF